MHCRGPAAAAAHVTKINREIEADVTVDSCFFLGFFWEGAGGCGGVVDSGGQWRCCTKESDSPSCLRFLTVAIAFHRTFFFSPLRFLNWRTELPQEVAFDCKYAVGKKKKSPAVSLKSFGLCYRSANK